MVLTSRITSHKSLSERLWDTYFVHFCTMAILYIFVEPVEILNSSLESWAGSGWTRAKSGMDPCGKTNLNPIQGLYKTHLNPIQGLYKILHEALVGIACYYVTGRLLTFQRKSKFLLFQNYISMKISQTL